MRKDTIKKFAFVQGLDLSKEYRIELPEEVPGTSDIDIILREIFSVDPETGLPRGDIAYYLSNDGNPAVKDWLVNNLLKPRGISSPNEVDDDTLLEFSRGTGESVSDYAMRLANIFNEAKSVESSES